MCLLRKIFCLLWCLLLCAVATLAASSAFADGIQPAETCFTGSGGTLLISLGDSLTQGTMNATNNYTNASNNYIQNLAWSLAQSQDICFKQPQLDTDENRIDFITISTNLGVDGADIFTLEGFEYYKRYGVKTSFLTRHYLADRLLPWNLHDMYDTVLYPINLLARAPVSQLDSAIWLINRQAQQNPSARTILIFWCGNNDSSNASLGYGAIRPTYIPLPLDLIEDELAPEIRAIMEIGLQTELISFDPYLLESITRNLTDEEDFRKQYEHCLSRLSSETPFASGAIDIFLCTLPYYSSVGYLFDSDDIEFYFHKVDASYTVPASFKRVTEPGTPIADYTRGDRISLITFLCMYVLLNQGYTPEYVNQVIDTNGVQRDGLVLSEDEQAFIRERIDRFNDIIHEAADQYGHQQVHLVDAGRYLNDVLTGRSDFIVEGKQFARKWGRGNSFTIDGVHPGYTSNANIANYLIAAINEQLGLQAPLTDLSAVMNNDPYVDRDGDGWVPGPDYVSSGITELLFLFKDPDDTDPEIQPEMPDDIWQRISDVLIKIIL